MELDEDVVRMMNLYFSSSVSIALSTNDEVLALDTYATPEKLPQTTTKNDLFVQGYNISGPLFHGSSLTVCYKESKYTF